MIIAASVSGAIVVPERAEPLFALKRRRSPAIGRATTRFVGLELHDRVPDANTIWLSARRWFGPGAIDRLFERFDAMLREKSWLAMGGQIVDATLVHARRSRLTSKLDGDTARQPETAVGCSAAVILADLGAI